MLIKAIIGVVIVFIVSAIISAISVQKAEAEEIKALEQEKQERTRWTPQEQAVHEELYKSASSGGRMELLNYAMWLDDHKQYSDAVIWYTKLIELDIPPYSQREKPDYERGVAYYRMGVMYRRGNGVSKDDKAANRNFSYAMNLGNEDGTLALIEALRNNIGYDKRNSASNRSCADFFERELEKKRRRSEKIL